MANRWLDHETWGCDVHVPMAKIPANIEKCWYCAQEWRGHRPKGDPPAKKEVKPPEPKKGPWGQTFMPPVRVTPEPYKMPVSRLLHMESMAKPLAPQTTTYASTPKGKPNPFLLKTHGKCAWEKCIQAAREKSKYCSRECSNRNARFRAEQRGTG
jgi:hypothetical protein